MRKAVMKGFSPPPLDKPAGTWYNRFCGRRARSEGEGMKLKKPTKEQLIEKLVNFKGFPQEAELPSAPKQFIQYLEEDNRPQVTLDVDYENGMGVSIGRLREDTMYDYKFIGLSHNTVRGAAGGAVLCAEALTAKGYIAKK